MAVPRVGTRSAPSSSPMLIPDGSIDDLTLITPYPAMNSAAAMEIQNSAPSTPDRYAPRPSTPTAMSRASASEHTRQTANTCDRSNPCLRTNMFWGPIASMSPMLRAKPATPADNTPMPRHEGLAP